MHKHTYTRTHAHTHSDSFCSHYNCPGYSDNVPCSIFLAFPLPVVEQLDISLFNHSLPETRRLKTFCDQNRLLTSTRAKYLKDTNHIWF